MRLDTLQGIFCDRIGIFYPSQLLNKNFRWYIKIGHGRFVKNITFPLRAVFVTAFLHRCVVLAGLMFVPSSSRNMQRECQISCCQMIMEIFFSSGERPLRIWVFSLEVKAGAGFRKRGCIWHQSCVIFRCQCTSHLCNDDFPEGLWTPCITPLLNKCSFTQAWVLWKPASFCHFLSGRKRQDLLQAPRPPYLLLSRPWQCVSAVSDHWRGNEHVKNF